MEGTQKSDKCDSFGLIEGSWDNFKFERICPADVNEVLDHICTYFLKDETVCRLMGTSETFEREISELVTQMIGHNLSFLARCKDTGEIAGVRITFIEDEMRSPLPGFNRPHKDPRTDIFLHQLDLTDEQEYEFVNKWNAREYAELFIASTHPKFRNMGLCREMYKRSFVLLKAEEIRVLKVTCTGPVTMHITKELGFEPFLKIPYKDLEFSHCLNKEPLTDLHYAQVLVKVL